MRPRKSGRLLRQMQGAMATEFERPTFRHGQLEFRINADGVAIYGTRAGLTQLARICTDLASLRLGQDGTAHVHLEDYALLTADSVMAAVAVFE
jgi:hypothetical protein